MKKVALTALLLLLIAAESVFACTIFAVGKEATTDGSTMVSHTCDSTSDDLRLWLIPTQEAGTERDVVINGRKGQDYSQYPNLGYENGMVVGSYTFTEDTNQYIHAMYSFINDKGLAMGESTCGYDRNSEQGKKLSAAFKNVDGIWDCYMIQDLALETCSTAREAVELMGKLVSEDGWYGSCECINICDGDEAWIFEVYGGNQWVAVRVPDDMVFVAANRARVNYFVEDDPANYLYNPTIKSWAIENDLWDGQGDFIPCLVYANNPTRVYSTRREWMAMTLLDPSLNLDPEEKDPDHNWPLFVKPAEKISVATIHKICSNYYQGTDYDLTKFASAGPFGNPLDPRIEQTAGRAINSYRCTYIQIANVKSWLPDEAKCLAWFGWCAPDTTYLQPLFASVTELPELFTNGVREEYDPSTGWWTCALVQQTATINYQSAIQDIYAARDPKMATQYQVTAAIQNQAAKLIKDGKKDQAVQLLTSYVTQTAEDWHEYWTELSNKLIAKYMFQQVNMKSATVSNEWKQLEQTKVSDLID